MPRRATAPIAERRRATRFDGRGLIANLAGTLVDLHDISVGGARMDRKSSPADDNVTLVLYRREGSRINVNGSVRVTATIVHQDEGAVRVRFDSASFALSKLIVEHAAKQLGATPFAVK